jgi:predicted dehydrogenase
MNVGIIGMGFMGGVHLRNWQALDGAQVVAVCDANPIAGAATQGNLDVSSDTLNLDGVAIYTDVGEMLASEKLDAVSITLPTHLHKAISIQCLEAGVHVLCEKPMALNVSDCDDMLAAANKAGKHLMVGHCIRFWPVYVWAKKAIDDGGYGKVLAADFSRLTYAPAWDDAGWLSDPAKSGGIALDLHIHDLDFIQHLFGIPQTIKSFVSKLENGVPGHVLTALDYANNCTISATAGWTLPESFGFQMTFRIVCEKAAFVFDSMAKNELTVYLSDGEVITPELDESDGYKGEIEYFSQLVSGTNTETTITPEQARESVRMALETMI